MCDEWNGSWVQYAKNRDTLTASPYLQYSLDKNRAHLITFKCRQVTKPYERNLASFEVSHPLLFYGIDFQMSLVKTTLATPKPCPAITNCQSLIQYNLLRLLLSSDAKYEFPNTKNPLSRFWKSRIFLLACSKDIGNLLLRIRVFFWIFKKMSSKASFKDSFLEMTFEARCRYESTGLLIIKLLLVVCITYEEWPTPSSDANPPPAFIF